MPSLRGGCGLCDLSVWTISLSSAKPICVEFYRRTSPITIVGDRTAHWAKQLHAARRRLSGSKLVERSPRHLCSAGYIIFTGLLRFCALQALACARSAFAERPHLRVALKPAGRHVLRGTLHFER